MEPIFVHAHVLMCCDCLHLLAQTLEVLRNISNKVELQSERAASRQADVQPAGREASGRLECQRRREEVQPRRWWSLRLEECTPLTAPSFPPSVPWRVIKTDDSDGVPSGSTVSTAQPFCTIIYPTSPPPPPPPLPPL